MLKLSLQLPTYNYLESFYKTRVSKPKSQLNNELATPKAVSSKAAQIRADMNMLNLASNIFTNNNTSANDIYIPTVILRLQVDDLIVYKKRSLKFYMDNRASSALIYRDEKPVFIDGGLNNDAYCNKNASVTYFSKLGGVNTISLIGAARRISRHLFFVEFAGLSNYRRAFIGYFDRGQIRFIGIRVCEIELFDDTAHLISAVFGSKIKYEELLEDLK